MKTFFIREQYNGVLISLRSIVERLPSSTVVAWVFRNAKLHYGNPFGLGTLEFERLTHQMMGGFWVSDIDFRMMLDRTEIQVIDGRIEAMGLDCIAPLWNLDCVDATQWEISTPSHDLEGKLESNGFEMMED